MQITWCRIDNGSFVEQIKKDDGLMEFVIGYVDCHGEWSPTLNIESAKTRS
jgi:hypothetical protein